MAHPQTRRPSDDLQFAERAFLMAAVITMVVAGAYILGATGLPGDALVASVDWLSAQGYVGVEGPGADLALQAIHL